MNRMAIIVYIPAINNPVSSTTPNLIAAVKPRRDQRNGMINTGTGHFLALNINSPKVKMEVGQGSPNVGE